MVDVLVLLVHRRYIFNWAHRSVGITTFILASESPDFSFYVYIINHFFVKCMGPCLLLNAFSALCVVLRPHYSAQSMRFASHGPSEEVRPRQKNSKVRHSMRRFSRPKFRTSRQKYIVRRHRSESAQYSFIGQRHFKKATHACALSFCLDGSWAFAADTYTELHWPRRPGKTPYVQGLGTSAPTVRG